jgi:hypothetical protein
MQESMMSKKQASKKPAKAATELREQDLDQATGGAINGNLQIADLTSVAADSKSGGNTVYISTANGGVWKTTNK